jgi:hypothetical protein
MLLLAGALVAMFGVSWALASRRNARIPRTLAAETARIDLEDELEQHGRGEGIDRGSTTPKPRTEAPRYARFVSLDARGDGAPDAWEQGVLREGADGGERETIVVQRGGPHLRLARPLIANAECARCHRDARVGAPYGGVSVSVPMAPYEAIMRHEARAIGERHLLGMGVGVGLVAIFAVWFERARRARERAFEEREIAHARLDETLAAADVGTWEIDLATNVLTVDERWARIHGLAAGEVEPTADFARALVHPDDREAQWGVIREGLATGAPIELEHRAKHASGAWIWVSMRARVAARDAAGKPLRLGGTVHDVTDRRRAQEAALHASSTLRAVIDSTTAGVLFVTADRRIGFFNQAFRALVGPKAETLAEGNDAARHLPGAAAMFAEPRSFVALVERAYAEQVPIRGVALRLVDGRITEADYAPVVAAGERIGHLWHLRDVTERAQLEERLRQAEQLETVGRLAAGVAHDFNNVLTAIEGNASLLLELASASNAPEDHRELVDEILRASGHAATLVKQLLMFGRKQPLARRPLDVSALVGGTARMLRRALGERFEVIVELREGLPQVLADAALLEHALLNLALNARDAMPKGGRLWLSTREAAPRTPPPDGEPAVRWVCLEVRDDGQGIPPEHLAHVFDPFFTTKEFGQGTGLGLASVQGCVAQHGGVIELSSDVGQGTTFRVLLPALPEADARAAERDGAAKSAPRGGGELILVVEDEPPVRTLVCRVLERHGYRVKTAPSAAEAARLPAETIDQVALLLSDMVTPGGMDGRELADRLRATRPTLRVILYSGYPDDGELGGYPFLSKPFDPAALLALVRQELGAR